MRIALLSYRTKEHSGGQGVYVRNLAAGLAELGHEVEVFSGQPYPQSLDPRVTLTKVPSLDLYREPDPFRIPRPSEFADLVDVLEYATTLTACFAEPLSFSVRAARILAERAGDFDVVHDNQSLGYGLLGIARHLPLVATIHHPISRDRELALAAAPWYRKLSVARWYGFVRMQARVARRLPVLLGVSNVAAADAVEDFRLERSRIQVVPLGVDTDLFAPGAAAQRVPGRIVTVASADAPLKGVTYLLDAVAKLRTEREVELQLVCRLEPGGATERQIAALGLGDCVHVSSGLTDADLAGLLASAEVMCVPSLYEGFSLPTVEALACATPVVATRAGALPEVLGTDGNAAVLVEPGDAEALATEVGRLLDDPTERCRLGAAGRARAEDRYGWLSVARATVEAYERAIALDENGRADAHR
ncbi:MAG: glycosyltransferase family 4 protein [Dermatophilaceae bacterium]